MGTDTLQNEAEVKCQWKLFGPILVGFEKLRWIRAETCSGGVNHGAFMYSWPQVQAQGIPCAKTKTEGGPKLA